LARTPVGLDLSGKVHTIGVRGVVRFYRRPGIDL
jgi:hypothetical protein